MLVDWTGTWINLYSTTRHTRAHTHRRRHIWSHPSLYCITAIDAIACVIVCIRAVPVLVVSSLFQRKTVCHSVSYHHHWYICTFAHWLCVCMFVYLLIVCAKRPVRWLQSCSVVGRWHMLRATGTGTFLHLQSMHGTQDVARCSIKLVSVPTQNKFSACQLRFDCCSINKQFGKFSDASHTLYGRRIEVFDYSSARKRSTSDFFWAGTACIMVSFLSFAATALWWWNVAFVRECVCVCMCVERVKIVINWL